MGSHRAFSPALETHPKNVYLPQRPLIELVNAWLSMLVDDEHRAETAAPLAGSTRNTADDARLEQACAHLATAETHMRRLHDAIKAGANPAALVDALNQAYDEPTAARTLLEGLPRPTILGDAEVTGLIDHLGGLSRVLRVAQLEHLERVYRDVGLAMVGFVRES